MKSLKSFMLSVGVFVWSCFSSVAFAASDDGSDMFDPVIDKVDQTTSNLVLIASSLCVFMIVVFSLLMMAGITNKKLGVQIVGGATVLLVATNIANFLFS